MAIKYTHPQEMLNEFLGKRRLKKFQEEICGELAGVSLDQVRLYLLSFGEEGLEKLGGMLSEFVSATEALSKLENGILESREECYLSKLTRALDCLTESGFGDRSIINQYYVYKRGRGR